LEKKSILIIEKDEASAKKLREMLVSFGYEIAGIARTGEEAVDIVDKQVPDLILSAISLGGKMSGIDTARDILSRQFVPVIYLTMYADPDIVEKAKETRPYGYLIKPYDEQTIRTEIEIALYKFGLDRNFQAEHARLAEWVRQRTEELAKANEEIKVNEAKFREIFNAANDGIELHEIDDNGLPGKYVDANEVSCRMLGYTKEELLQLSPLDISAEYHSIPLTEIGNQLLAKGSVIFETVHRKKDGGTVPVEVNAHVVEIGGKRLVLSVIRDITERKQLFNEVVRSRDEWERTFDAVPDLIAIIDENYQVRRLNRAMADALGLLPGAAAGRHCYELVHHASSPPVICPHTQLLADRRSHTIDIHEENLHGDYQLTVSPLFGQDGKITGSVHILHDITRRKKNEQALRAMSGELQAIIDNAPAMIWYKDTGNTFIRVNPAAARAFGRPPDQIVGKNARDLFPQKLADQYYKDDLDVIRTGKPKLNIIEQITDASGETRWVQTEKLPVFGENGAVTGLLLFMVDITDRKMAQDALALANKKLGLMSSITRHDILNQLTALNSYIELCRLASPPQEIEEYIRKLAKISSTIERHIKFTQDYQTIGVNEPIWQDVGGCIFRSVAALPLGRVQVTTDIHEVKVLADPLLEKIFYNLIENALRHGGTTMTSIHIYSEEVDSGLKIIIEDNGNGIAPEDHPHLFTKGFGKNTGLGLFLSREILEITGMKIQENGTFGKGARFEISVPKGVYRIST